MGEVATAVSEEAFSALAENLGHILETRALLCGITPEDIQGDVVVEAALSRCDGADSVVVTTAASGNLAALLDAFHAALHLGVRPRRLADAQWAVENELARPSWPVVVVRDAHLLRTARPHPEGARPWAAIARGLSRRAVRTARAYADIDRQALEERVPDL
ncbi:hypothetical protein [Streptomyces sp. NPDC002132]|uniref:hypothetical protein n=1 Tax=unclassified Streptomyces TaxID=2593676 RepID=UPI0033214F14